MPRKLVPPKMITTCLDCPFFSEGAYNYMCDHPDTGYQKIVSFDTIPPWCPLEDA